MVALQNAVRDSRVRRAGGWGLVFVVMLLIGAGMASVPGGGDSVAQVRRFYDQHTGLVLLSQTVELIATVPLVLFVLGLATSAFVRSRRDAILAGGALILASVLTLVPPVLLVLLHDQGSGRQVHALAVLSDVTDVVLFATIAGFALMCGSARKVPGWLRCLALLVGLMAGVRAVEILSRGSLLEVVAPIGFIVLVLAQSLSCCGRAPRRPRTHRHGPAWGSPRDWLRAGPGTAAG